MLLFAKYIERQSGKSAWESRIRMSPTAILAEPAWLILMEKNQEELYIGKDRTKETRSLGKTYVCDWDRRIILKTAMATLLLLLFFFAQGAIVVITGIEGIPSALIRGAVIWGLVIITLANSIIRYKGISKLGFRSAEKGAAKRMLYFSPLLLIALSPFTAGININGGAALILANLFLTLGIGMAEEIFFRGIIFGLWLEHGVGKAMIISSVLFGFSHLLNIAGGAELGETVLQICFALVYGMVFALIFAESGSLLPCVLLHALHDFCSFISGEASAQFEIFLGAVQFIVLLVYFLYLFRITARKREPALKGR